MTNPFPTEVYIEDLSGLKPKPNPPDHGHEMRRFWFLCAPLGFILSLVWSILLDADVFFPAGCVFTFLLWAVGVGAKKDSSS